MRTQAVTMPKVMLLVVGFLVGGLIALVAFSGIISQNHETVTHSTDIASMERWFPVLAGHIMRTEWTIIRIGNPMPLVPEPTDCELWGHVVIDGTLSDMLRQEYDWEDTLLSVRDARRFDSDKNPNRKWLTNLEFDEAMAEPFVGNMYFDGRNALSFSGYVM